MDNVVRGIVSKVVSEDCWCRSWPRGVREWRRVRVGLRMPCWVGAVLLSGVDYVVMIRDCDCSPEWVYWL